MVNKFLVISFALLISCKAEPKLSELPTEIRIAMELQKLSTNSKSNIEIPDSLPYTNTICPDMSDTAIITQIKADSVFIQIAHSYFLTSIKKDDAGNILYYFRPQYKKQFINQNLMAYSNRLSNKEASIEFEYEYQSGYTFLLILKKNKIIGISKYEPC